VSKDKKGTSILDDNNKQFRAAEPRRFTAAQFARLSSSMQLTLIIIRRAQRSSREAFAKTLHAKWRHDTRE